MDLFIGGKLNPSAFEINVRTATHDLNDVLLAAAETKSRVVESTHFLIALARVPDGATHRGLRQQGVSADAWQSGLQEFAVKAANAIPPGHLTTDALDESAQQMLRATEQRCAQTGSPRITEPILLWAALRHLSPAARDGFQGVELDVDGWCKEIERELAPVKGLPVFEQREPRTLIVNSFSPSGREVLKRMLDEAQAMGYAQADPRHLLLGLLSCDGGAAQVGLHSQAVTPRRVQEALTVSLRGGSKSTRSSLDLDANHMQRMLQGILQSAGQLAGRDSTGKIHEMHLLRAFLTVDSAARSILEQQSVRIDDLRASAEQIGISEEMDEDETAIADIETVKSRLRDRLVGQDDAIEQILPYIELLRFGFNVKDRPVGVFLYCGPSGTGKTEMAKELARSIYGSEDKLIFLEMGRFCRPENINEFVGAPPGYVGYGEGKLTNGLRDNPESVVLFDEVEKADPRVLDALLRFLDEGKITDPAGPVRDGTRCVVVLTSNVATGDLDGLTQRPGECEGLRTQLRRELRERFRDHEFRVEFLNRVDEVIMFRGLQRQHYAEIARRQFAPLLRDLEQRQQIHVQLGEELAEAIGAYCEVLNEGARPVSRLTRSMVLLPVARFVAVNRCARPVKLRVRVDHGGGAASEPIPIVELA